MEPAETVTVEPYGQGVTAVVGVTRHGHTQPATPGPASSTALPAKPTAAPTVIVDVRHEPGPNDLDYWIAGGQILAALATVAAVIVALRQIRQARSDASTDRQAAADQFDAERIQAADDSRRREESLRRQVVEERREADRRLQLDQRAADRRLALEREATAAENTRMFVLQTLLTLSDLYGHLDLTAEGARGRVIAHALALPPDCCALIRLQFGLATAGIGQDKLDSIATMLGNPIPTPPPAALVRSELAFDLHRYAQARVLPLDADQLARVAAGEAMSTAALNPEEK